MEDFLNSTLFTQLKDEGKFPEVPVSFTRKALIDMSITILIVVIIILLIIAILNKVK